MDETRTIRNLFSTALQIPADDRLERYPSEVGFMKFSEACAIKRGIAPHHLAYNQWRDQCERCLAMNLDRPAAPPEVLSYKAKHDALIAGCRRDWRFGDLRVTIIDKAPPQVELLDLHFIVTLPGGGDFSANLADIMSMRKQLLRIQRARAQFDLWLCGVQDELPLEPNC